MSTSFNAAELAAVNQLLTPTDLPTINKTQVGGGLDHNINEYNDLVVPFEPSTGGKAHVGRVAANNAEVVSLDDQLEDEHGGIGGDTGEATFQEWWNDPVIKNARRLLSIVPSTSAGMNGIEGLVRAGQGINSGRPSEVAKGILQGKFGVVLEDPKAKPDENDKAATKKIEAVYDLFKIATGGGGDAETVLGLAETLLPEGQAKKVAGQLSDAAGLVDGVESSNLIKVVDKTGQLTGEKALTSLANAASFIKELEGAVSLLKAGQPTELGELLKEEKYSEILDKLVENKYLKPGAAVIDAINGGRRDQVLAAFSLAEAGGYDVQNARLVDHLVHGGKAAQSKDYESLLSEGAKALDIIENQVDAQSVKGINNDVDSIWDGLESGEEI